MSTESKLFSQKPVFHELFEDRESVFSYFSEENNARYQIFFAIYEDEDYSGHATVLGFDYKEEKFFEVHGSHCSCYGLEDQWEPEYFESFEQLSVYLQKPDRFLGFAYQEFVDAFFKN